MYFYEYVQAQWSSNWLALEYFQVSWSSKWLVLQYVQNQSSRNQVLRFKCVFYLLPNPNELLNVFWDFFESSRSILHSMRTICSMKIRQDHQISKHIYILALHFYFPWGVWVPKHEGRDSTYRCNPYHQEYWILHCRNRDTPPADWRLGGTVSSECWYLIRPWIPDSCVVMSSIAWSAICIPLGSPLFNLGANQSGH